MSQFNTGKWFKNQYLKEAGLNESKADSVAKAMDDAIASVDPNLSVKDFALIMGVPGKQVGWVSKFGNSIPIPDNAKEFDYTCPETGDKYHFDGEHLFLVS